MNVYAPSWSMPMGSLSGKERTVSVSCERKISAGRSWRGIRWVSMKCASLSCSVARHVRAGGEPRPPRVGQDGIEDDEPLDRARQRGRLAMPIVWFANRGVERFVVDV